MTEVVPGTLALRREGGRRGILSSAGAGHSSHLQPEHFLFSGAGAFFHLRREHFLVSGGGAFILVICGGSHSLVSEAGASFHLRYRSIFCSDSRGRWKAKRMSIGRGIAAISRPSAV